MFKIPDLPSVVDLPEGTTKGELAERLYPGVTFDTALPQPWVNECQALGFDPRPGFVWGFPAGLIWGTPLPLTAEAWKNAPREMLQLEVDG